MIGDNIYLGCTHHHNNNIILKINLKNVFNILLICEVIDKLKKFKKCMPKQNN